MTEPWRTISVSLRYEILRRDNHTCRYCGSMAPDVKLEVDHVTPRALGGSDDPANLVTSCRDCNQGKGSTPPDAPLVEDVAQDALRWRRALSAAYEMANREREYTEGWTDQFVAVWLSWKTNGGKGEPVELPGDWRLKMSELAVAGLSGLDAKDAITAAMSRRNVDDIFAYCLAICRSKLAQRQSIAADLIRQGLV